MGKNLVYAVTPNRTTPDFSLTEYAAAGAFSALPTTLVAAPMERVKVLLQVRTHPGLRIARWSRPRTD
jgi:solute carrier family 25 carnitine/acylcarnitine transporter 20/29